MKTQIDEFLSDPESNRLFQRERLILEFTEAVCEALERTGRTQSWLAGQLGVSPSEVTQMLNGRNVTLNKVSDVMTALGMRAVLVMVVMEVKT